MEIEGNETVNIKAKKAATAKEKNRTKPTKPDLKSARNATIKTQIKEKWTKIWNNGKETATQLRGMSK